MPYTLEQIAGSPAAVLERGMPATLASAIGAAQTLANAGSASQKSNPYFTVGPMDEGYRVLNLSARFAGGIQATSALSATVYGSDDGGTTWKAFAAAVALATAGVATDAQIANLPPGRVYQVLVTSLTLGGAASASVDGAVS